MKKFDLEKFSYSPAGRGLRIGMGIVIFIMGIIYHSWWGILGVFPLLSGVLNSCPLFIMKRYQKVTNKMKPSYKFVQKRK